MGRKFIYLLPTLENPNLKQDPRLVEPNNLDVDSSHRLDLSKLRQYLELTSQEAVPRGGQESPRCLECLEPSWASP
ncbi:UNVERIFIED_CONTAM: hypothetical protein Sangu_1443200 [Sesamum angustifolium]|uniref:Uncharacterized protein n=1 Tax=Sesamum angustifolium TaxID=2727405 RepID=A0AAW2N6Z7_9LAMI